MLMPKKTETTTSKVLEHKRDGERGRERQRVFPSCFGLKRITALGHVSLFPYLPPCLLVGSAQHWLLCPGGGYTFTSCRPRSLASCDVHQACVEGGKGGTSIPGSQRRVSLRGGRSPYPFYLSQTPPPLISQNNPISKPSYNSALLIPLNL